jgi:hypothetical protein
LWSQPNFSIELFEIVSHEHMGWGPEVRSPNRSKLFKQLATILSRSQLQGFLLLKRVKSNLPQQPHKFLVATMAATPPVGPTAKFAVEQDENTFAAVDVQIILIGY